MSNILDISIRNQRSKSSGV